MRFALKVQIGNHNNVVFCFELCVSMRGVYESISGGQTVVLYVIAIPIEDVIYKTIFLAKWNTLRRQRLKALPIYFKIQKQDVHNS